MGFSLKIPPLPRTSKRTLAISGVVLLLTVALVAAAYFYRQSQATRDELARVKSMTVTVPQAATVLQQIGGLMELPSDEEPQVATITDKSKLENQPLLTKAQNQDVFVVYSKARKAILYRPSTNKIIDVFPITVSSPTPIVSPKPTGVGGPSPKPSPTPIVSPKPTGAGGPSPTP